MKEITEEQAKRLVGIIFGEFNDLVVKMVTDKDEARLTVVDNPVFDVEILIRVSSNDEHIFSSEVLEKLTESFKKLSGLANPAIYLEGKPTKALVGQMVSELLFAV